MQKLGVNLGDRSYDILIGEGLFTELADHIPLKKTYIITDETIAGLHLENLQLSLDEMGIEHVTKILPSGEQTKCFNELEELTSWLLKKRVERKSTVIAFGGGVIGDLVGFAASITLRGINFIQVPTTLLSQVDSSVGGKTAINSEHGKNLIGAFYQPKLVLADTSLLATLSPREFLSGYAEVVKYGLINDAKFFEWLDENDIQNPSILKEAIFKSCKAKADIVAEDEREGGKRALLNLGHTFGHALEAETGYSDKLLHGEAVSIGMIMAFEFSKKLGLCDEAEVQKVKTHFDKLGLPIDPHKYLDEWNVDELISHMKSDKKVEDGRMVFILTKGIGQAFIDKKVKEEDLREFLESYGK